MATTAALGPVGGVIASVLVNTAKDAMLGQIHSVSDLSKSLLVGGVTAMISEATGGLGGDLVKGAASPIICPTPAPRPR